MQELTHLGVIMDGNGRWAKQRGLKRYQGHEQGVKTFEKLLTWCMELKISYLSVYAFSTENWTRDREEVHHIFFLLKKYIQLKRRKLIDHGICLKVIGDRSRLDDSCLTLLEDIEKQTEHNRKITVQLAVNYGGRDEIVRTTKKIYGDLKKQILCENDLTEAVFNDYLDTKGTPDLDLIIRTGKHKRASNFLLWQSHYAELYFSDLMWPDFSKAALDEALLVYHKSKRNYGHA